MIASEQQLRAEVTQAARALHAKGWVANHDGNVTARLSANRFLATPTAISKADTHERGLIVLDALGNRISGEGKPFSEIALHLAAYETRRDVEAVVHAHPTHATAFGVAGRGLDRPLIAEAVVSLGARIPLVPYALPGTPESTDLLKTALIYNDAVLLGNHGVLTVGASVEQAYLRMELVEHLAEIQYRAQMLGEVRFLPADHVKALLERRAKAGLGPRARGLSDEPVVLPDEDPDPLRRLIAEELRGLLSAPRSA